MKKCKDGHDLAIVGFYDYGSGRQCKACKRERYKTHATGGWGPKPILEFKNGESYYPNAKLTARQIEEIINSPESGRHLAVSFGVHESTISRIRRNHSWKDNAVNKKTG